MKISIKLIKDEESLQVIEFLCEDSGVGISKEALAHIFEDFYQESHSQNNHRVSGSGLGLSITKNIVALMGGQISITSEKEIGTKVTVVIPLEKVNPDQLENKNIDADDCSLIEGKRILIVEDNHLNRMLFTLMLGNMKAVVEEAENGFEALGKIENTKFDLILMDIQMPVMDGPTALAAIKKKYGDTIPVIALTAAAFKSEVNHMLNLGFSDCYTKPIDQKNLQHRLCQFFSHGSVRDKYYASIHKKIISSISEMAGNDPVQFTKMMEYLLEEVEYALLDWNQSVAIKDWPRAKKILHREKVMIKSIGIHGFDGLIKEIEDDSIDKTEAEMILMFNQLVDLFKNLKSKFSSFNP